MVFSVFEMEGPHMKTTRKNKRVFSINEVAGACQVSAESIRRWIRLHGLNAYNVKDGLAIKIMESDLRAFSERMKLFVDWDYLDE